jgi:type I restriction enzyme M protein
MGFRLNSKKSGKRWIKFTNQVYPAISSIISLPRDIFPQVEFHSEILIFNITGLQPHYFFNPNYE